MILVGLLQLRILNSVYLFQSVPVRPRCTEVLDTVFVSFHPQLGYRDA